MNRLGHAAVVGLVCALVAGCGGPTHRAAPVSATTSPAASPDASPAAARSAVIDVSMLPQGPATTVPHLAAGVLSWHEREVVTDLPADAAEPSILGSVDGRVVLTAYAGRGDRFWSVGRDGHARRLGRTYHSYDYAPRLVASTGHLWVQHTDRTSPRTIWEIDARTGQQLAVWDHDAVPRGLEPADQALVDAWIDRRSAVPGVEDDTRDGTLHAGVRDLSTVVVRRTADRAVLARFTFATTDYGGVDRVVFEDAAHVLVLLTTSVSRRHGSQQVILRCDVVGGTCERTTAIGGSMALGVDRPLFEPAR